MATNKCPYCYRPLGIHTHDPILLIDGCPYKWSSDTTLISEPDITQRDYKGSNHICESEIIELRTELETLEAENGVTPLSIFSPLNTSGKFQFTGYHLKEMRNSVEKILTAIGMTKTEYFNYDEERNHIIHPNGDKIDWTDPITLAVDLEKFQIKAIHIEDLRHYISILWQETWTDESVFSKSASITEGGGTDSEDFNFVADHSWGTGVAWDACQVLANGSDLGCTSSASTSGGSYVANAYCISAAVKSGIYHWHTASGQVKLFCHFTKYEPLSSVTNFKIENLIFSSNGEIVENQQYSGRPNNPPTGATFEDISYASTYIKIEVKLGNSGWGMGLTPLKTLTYYGARKGGGKPGLTNAIDLGDSFSGNLLRNLWEDFKTMWGKYPDDPSYSPTYNTICEIRFTIVSTSAANAYYTEPPESWNNAFGSNCNCSLSMQTIKLGAVS